MNKMRLTVLLGVMTCLMLMPAKANILVSFGSATGAGPFTWTYNATLQVGEETSESDAGGPYPTFFTLYDIGGLVSGSESAPGGWTATEQMTGITPTGLAPSDSPSLVNITWTYTGAPIIPTSTDAALGAFSFNSTQGNQGLIITYTQQATKNNPGHPDDDSRDAGFGNVVGPSAVPEPMTFSMMGLGLLGLGVMRRRQQGKK
jgi:hypothetical protein